MAYSGCWKGWWHRCAQPAVSLLWLMFLTFTRCQRMLFARCLTRDVKPTLAFLSQVSEQLSVI